MESKVILFDGGPFNNEFREVPIDTKEVKYYEQPKLLKVITPSGEPPVVESIVRYYRETTTKYNNIPVFVWIELKPTENESNNEATEITKV